MKITLLVVGKTTDSFIKQGMDVYIDRLKHYCQLSIIEMSELKVSSKLSMAEIKKREGELILSKIPQHARVWLLDENGKDFTSRQFAKCVEQYQIDSVKELWFVVGGAYGFSDDVYAAFQSKISFSKMTFSHQMIRLFFVEQVYRAYSIIHNLPYHHD